MSDHITYVRMTEIAEKLFSFLCDNELILEALHDTDLDLSNAEMQYFLGISDDEVKRPLPEKDTIKVETMSEYLGRKLLPH